MVGCQAGCGLPHLMAVGYKFFLNSVSNLVFVSFSSRRII